MDASSFDISASGMRAQRFRMDLIAGNLANVETTSARREAVAGPDGQSSVRHVPFRRKMAVLMQGPRGGVAVRSVVEDQSAFRAEHDPGHPHAVPAASGAADAGTVYYPNVHPLVEMVDMMSATRAYEANLSALEAFKSMNASALRILA